MKDNTHNSNADHGSFGVNYTYWGQHTVVSACEAVFFSGNKAFDLSDGRCKATSGSPITNKFSESNHHTEHF